MRRAVARHARIGTTVTAAIVATAAGVVSVAPAAASPAPTVGSDRTDITRLEQQIATNGRKVQSLVSRFNDAQARLDSVRAQITDDEERLAADARVEAAARAVLRRAAAVAYVTGGNAADLSALTMFDGTDSINATLAQGHYLAAVNDKITTALTTLRAEEARTKDARNALLADEKQAQATVAELAQARSASEAAIAADNALLSKTKTNLKALLAKKLREQEAEELAKERALAARAIKPPVAIVPVTHTTRRVHLPAPVAASLPAPPPPAPVAPSSPGQYANPLRALSALTPERIDQGVDYACFGPIYAIGNGVVLTTSIPGWPGGTFIAYQLSDGPAAGLVVFAAEDIQPTVQVGQRVSANTVIGQAYLGPDGIETGWADPNALGNTMARSAGQFSGGNSTAFGDNFSRLLQALGAPGGILQNNPPTGSLPADWPRW
jgi:murein DD-endopeptidase MepM/ murein hydrolase activator NlpD